MQQPAVGALVRSGTAAPETTSAGRLFDAVAALCGIRAAINYEGQAAAELEAACDPAARDEYPMPVAEPQRGAAGAAESSGSAGSAGPPAAAPLVLDARATIAAVVEDLARGVAPGVVAARFHGALARATADACALVAARRGLDAVVLSGGAFQNRVLLERTTALLDETACAFWCQDGSRLTTAVSPTARLRSPRTPDRSARPPKGCG